MTVVGVEINYSIFSHAASVSMAALESTLTNPTSVATMSTILTQSFPQATIQPPVLLLPTTTPTSPPFAETSNPSLSSTTSPGTLSAPPSSFTSLTHTDIVVVSVVGSLVLLLAVGMGIWYHRKKLWNKFRPCTRERCGMGLGWGTGSQQVHHRHHLGDQASSLVVPVDDGGNDIVMNYHNDNHNISTNHIHDDNNARRSSHSQYSIRIFASEMDGSEEQSLSSPLHLNGQGPSSSPHQLEDNQLEDNHLDDNHHVHNPEFVHDVDDVREEEDNGDDNNDVNHKGQEVVFHADQESTDHVVAMVSLPCAGEGGGPSTSSSVCSSSLGLSNNNTPHITAIKSPVDTRPDSLEGDNNTVDIAATPHKTNDTISVPNNNDNTNDNTIDSTPTSNHSMDHTSTPSNTINTSTPDGSSTCGSAGQGNGKDTTPSTVITPTSETPLADGARDQPEEEEGMNIGGIFASLKYF